MVYTVLGLLENDLLTETFIESSIFSQYYRKRVLTAKRGTARFVVSRPMVGGHVIHQC